MTTDATLGLLQHYIAEADATLARFSADLAKDPAYAFEWSASAFEAAATKRVLGEVLRRLASESQSAVLARAEAEVRLRAKRGSKSTSEASNLMEAELMSAWARTAELLAYQGAAP